MKIAFCKFAGMGNGGIEKYLQTMAIIFKNAGHQVDYFYTNAAPLLNTSWIHPDNNQDRIDLMIKEGINLIPLYVQYRVHNEWVNNDFFEKFKEEDYDFIVTGGNGQSEFPYNRLFKIPIIHTIHGIHPFNQDNIHKSVLLCDWQASQWKARGGDASKVKLIPSVVYVPDSHTKTFRAKHGIPENAFVYGFHQRNDSGLSSLISLQAYAQLNQSDAYFAILGGSDVHRRYTHDANIPNVVFGDYTTSVNDIHDFLDAIDVYAHCRTDGEVCSASIIEAMSHAKPLISVPGQNMGHADQLDGCGTMAGSIEDYKEEMLRLRDSAYYSAMSQKVKAKYDQTYDFKVVEREVLSLIN